MIKRIITEISEEDFRKLNLVGRTRKMDRTLRKMVTTEVKLNDVLDREIQFLLETGTGKSFKSLALPVTIAIHEPYPKSFYNKMRAAMPNNTDEEVKDYCESVYMYFDKFMDRLTGPASFEVGIGIKHLYSTRDYYEARDDYWRVNKKDTKVIYRINLSPEWLSKFELKHKTEIMDWPYNVLPDNVTPDFEKAELHITYRKVNDEWVEEYRSGVFRYDNVTVVTGVTEDNENGN